MRKKIFKFNIVLAWRPVDNTNISFTILQENFTKNRFFVIDTTTSSFYGKQTKHAKNKFDRDLNVPEKTFLLLENGLNL